MAEEIEAKVKLRDPEVLRRRMARYDPPAAGPVLEVNRLFDFADGALGRAGSALRVREEFRLDTGAAVRTLLAYKGPRRESRMKRR
jgi:adenylate cyclase class IV